MNSRRLIIQSLLHFWQRNTLLAIGFSISTAVLTGALIVGDSVKASLHTIAARRLGNVSVVMQSGDRYFSSELLKNLQEKYENPAAAVLLLDALGVADGGQKRINNIQVVGVDESFDAMSPKESRFGSLRNDSVFISQNISDRLNLSAGDEFLLKITRASLVPMNAPFVSDADNILTIRAYVADIVGADELGAFNLKTSQTAPFNVFISAARLQEEMEIGSRYNVLLCTGDNLTGIELEDLVADSWLPPDAGLSINYNRKNKRADIKSDRVFIEDALVEAFINTRLSVSPVLTYFVNAIQFNENLTPYSFVSTLDKAGLAPDEIIINTWLAEDLKAAPGDTIQLTYFIVGLLRELEEKSKKFVVKSIVPLEGEYADPGLMPDIPGMSDAGNCRDWETGVPIELGEIRDKDENYWTRYKGTPKAFIAPETAVLLWKNRFGTYTSLQLDSGMLPDVSDFDSIAEINAKVSETVSEVMKSIRPTDIGFEFRSILSEASYAAENGVDFSELFGGLSFFLLAGAILLTVMLFRLNLESRKEQVVILSSMGIPEKRILRIMMVEGFWIAILGAVFGLLLAIIYNSLIFYALNSIWMDIVRTAMLQIHIRFSSMLMGFSISVFLAMLVIFMVLKRQLKIQLRTHIRKSQEKFSFLRKGTVSLLAVTSGLTGIVIIVFQVIAGTGIDASLFFLAGGLFLLSGVLLSFNYLLRARLKSMTSFNLHSLSRKNAVSNMPRSMSIILLLSLGTFIVLSTGSNRKDLFASMEDKDSGTGGFLYYAESTIPVLQKLSDENTRFEYGLSDRYNIIQMRISEGDDASCLNLNRISNPRIIGVNPSSLQDRFSFITFSERLDKNQPWQSLELDLEDGLIPAIADETVIKWGLGMKVGDTLRYQDARGDTLNLLLVGGLAPSIFQGSVIIDEKQFIKRFPSSSGSEVFLIERSLGDSTLIMDEISAGMRDLGWAMELTGKRLTELNSVTNTYLSIFMILGALGLLLATVGLSMLIFRSIHERKAELGILRASGFSLSRVKSLIMREYLMLLFLGTFSGAIPAIIATLPSFISRNTELSLLLIISIVLLLLINGIFWIWLVSRLSLNNKILVESLRKE